MRPRGSLRERPCGCSPRQRKDSGGCPVAPGSLSWSAHCQIVKQLGPPTPSQQVRGRRRGGSRVIELLSLCSLLRATIPLSGGRGERSWHVTFVYPNISGSRSELQCKASSTHGQCSCCSGRVGCGEPDCSQAGEGALPEGASQEQCALHLLHWVFM